MAGELGQLDHHFGRAKVPEAVSNCQLLCPQCHDDKTQNRPTAAHWELKFVLFAMEHGFTEEAHRAAIRLSVLEQKGLAYDR